jgi:hypothetical protein
MIELALAGEPTALKACFDRLVPRGCIATPPDEEVDTRPGALLQTLHAVADDARANGHYGAAITALRTSAEIQSVPRGGLPVLSVSDMTDEELREMLRRAAESLGLRLVDGEDSLLDRPR